MQIHVCRQHDVCVFLLLLFLLFFFIFSYSVYICVWMEFILLVVNMSWDLGEVFVGKATLHPPHHHTHTFTQPFFFFFEFTDFYKCLKLTHDTGIGTFIHGNAKDWIFSEVTYAAWCLLTGDFLWSHLCGLMSSAWWFAQKSLLVPSTRCFLCSNVFRFDVLCWVFTTLPVTETVRLPCASFRTGIHGEGMTDIVVWRMSDSFS